VYRLFKKSAVVFFTLFLVNAFSVAETTPAAFESKPLITPAQAQTIYRHLVESHWVPETGLFISFLGTQDKKLAQQSSTYEQGAVGLLAVRMGDMARAKGIFKFLRNAWAEGPYKGGREGVSGLSNFYNAEFGGEGIEKTIHAGPNAWAGLFAAYYGNKAGDKEAIDWALEMATWMTHEIPHRDGGIAMGPVDSGGVPWTQVYSTENNVSYYAFLAELLRSTQLSENDRTWLTAEKNHIEDWLVLTAFDPLAYTMNRGVNLSGADRTRALDTTTWLISALGPECLKKRGIDPDKLMQYAEEAFVVHVNGRAGVDATDQPEADMTYESPPELFSLHPEPPRIAEDQHRMIWYEGLGQYINALNAMAAFAHQNGEEEKAVSYMKKAQHMTEEFDLASLSNQSFGTAFIYATYGKFFHDGWYTPQDAADGPPSSLVAAVWRCFAGLGMDPLAGEQIASVPVVDVQAPKIAEAPHTRPALLYGASDDMVIEAWQRLVRGDYQPAIEQAQATIEEWAPWAIKLEDQKQRQVGHTISYDGLSEQRQEIFKYWALNDVAAAYFIIGKASDHENDYAQAADAFQQIVRNYPLAQIWDPRGWFWAPVDSVQEEYVARYPRRYGRIIPPVLAANSNPDRQPN
jgi:hypothetical protein